jgi:hypothetical protein
MRFYLPVLLGLFALAACGKKANNTTDAGGYCTSNYIADHNDVKYKLDLVKSDCEFSPGSEFCRQDKSAARASCDNYQANHKAGRQCTAMSADLSRSLKLDTTDVHNACNAFRARYPF